MEKLMMNPSTGTIQTETEWLSDFASCTPEEWGGDTFEDASLVELDLDQKIAFYDETEMPEPTGRVLDGSSDHGYDQEWFGYGTIGTVKVKAVYLFDDSDVDEADLEYPDRWDWDLALKRFESID